jgi:histidinol dehydrogenase
MPGLKIIAREDIPSDCSEPVNAKVLEQARVIVNEIRSRGEAAFIEFSTKYGDIKEGESYAYTKAELKEAFDSLPEEHKGVLTRVVRHLSQ